MRLSHKFDTESVYHNGRYYFPEDTETLGDGRISIQVVYYRGKWRQDTSYISPQLNNELQEFYSN